MQLPCVLHAVTMRLFTYIPSYLVILSLASYYLLLNPTALKTWKRDTLDHLNHQWHLHFSLYQKKMEDYDPAKITDI